MKPKIVIITTPNREYNVLFENFEGPFRHWDHKFEWTRSEFQNWVQTCIVDKYPDYIVERFDGLGKDLFRNGRNAQFSHILMVVCVFGLCHVGCVKCTMQRVVYSGWSVCAHCVVVLYASYVFV